MRCIILSFVLAHDLCQTVLYSSYEVQMKSAFLFRICLMLELHQQPVHKLGKIFIFMWPYASSFPYLYCVITFIMEEHNHIMFAVGQRP